MTETQFDLALIATCISLLAPVPAIGTRLGCWPPEAETCMAWALLALAIVIALTLLGGWEAGWLW